MMINCYDLIDMTEDCLFRGYFYDGFFEAVNSERDFVFEITDEDLDNVFQVALNMHEVPKAPREKIASKKYKAWYKKWRDHPVDMKEIGEVIGKLIIKDRSVIEDISACYDANYLGNALTYKDPKKFKEYLEKSKPDWEKEYEGQTIFEEV